MDKSCTDVEIGRYGCAITVDGIQCDRCLSNEVIKLNETGVKTTGSCCGHGFGIPFIQVDDNSVTKMIELGYEIIPVDSYGNGENAFKPKSILVIQRRRVDGSK